MTSSSTLREWSLLNRSSITILKKLTRSYDQNEGAMNLNRLKSSSYNLKVQKNMEAMRQIVWGPRKLCFLCRKLHDFFWVPISSSKLHDFFVISLSSSVEICTLRSELHETRPKKSVLILIGKIRGFLKSLRFWTLFQFPVGSSQTCKDLAAKTRIKLHFSSV